MELDRNKNILINKAHSKSTGIYKIGMKNVSKLSGNRKKPRMGAKVKLMRMTSGCSGCSVHNKGNRYTKVTVFFKMEF